MVYGRRDYCRPIFVIGSVLWYGFVTVVWEITEWGLFFFTDCFFRAGYCECQEDEKVLKYFKFKSKHNICKQWWWSWMRKW